MLDQVQPGLILYQDYLTNRDYKATLEYPYEIENLETLHNIDARRNQPPIYLTSSLASGPIYTTPFFLDRFYNVTIKIPPFETKNEK